MEVTDASKSEKIFASCKSEEIAISKDDEVKKDLSTQGYTGGDKSSLRTDLNECTNLKRNEKLNKQNEKGFVSKTRKQDHATLSGKLKTEGSEVISSDQASRVSLLKPPKLLSKCNSPEVKPGGKHGEKKSNIPVFRRSSKEFEDIRNPQESPKRSLIPQR